MSEDSLKDNPIYKFFNTYQDESSDMYLDIKKMLLSPKGFNYPISVDDIRTTEFSYYTNKKIKSINIIYSRQCSILSILSEKQVNESTYGIRLTGDHVHLFTDEKIQFSIDGEIFTSEHIDFRSTNREFRISARNQNDDLDINKKILNALMANNQVVINIKLLEIPDDGLRKKYEIKSHLDTNKAFMQELFNNTVKPVLFYKIKQTKNDYIEEMKSKDLSIDDLSEDNQKKVFKALKPNSENFAKLSLDFFGKLNYTEEDVAGLTAYSYVEKCKKHYITYIIQKLANLDIFLTYHSRISYSVGFGSINKNYDQGCTHLKKIYLANK